MRGLWGLGAAIEAWPFVAVWPDAAVWSAIGAVCQEAAPLSHSCLPAYPSCLQFGTGTAAQSEAGKKGGERAKEMGAGIVSLAGCPRGNVWHLTLPPEVPAGLPAIVLYLLSTAMPARTLAAADG